MFVIYMNYEQILYNEIGKKIKIKRKKLAITQEQLAEITNYSLSFIANIESNTYQSFSIHALNNIAHALHTNMCELLPDEKLYELEIAILKCNHCSYELNIPIEIKKLLSTIEELFKQKIKLTCPKCQKKIMY